MLRPDWNEAPDWARWMAMDGDGEWYWYENKPGFVPWYQPSHWTRADRGGRMEFAGEDTSDAANHEQAENSLRQRLYAKPKWCDAPAWAQWLAMDSGGQWYWYEEKPSFEGPVWMGGEGRVVCASEGSRFTPGSGNSLEQRP